MNLKIDKINRALFEGNRDEVIRLLDINPEKPIGGSQELWLLAAAIEDEEQRLKLLEIVASSTQQPYAKMAKEIINREVLFDEQMKAKGNVGRFVDNHRRSLIIFTSLLLAFGIGFIILTFLWPTLEDLWLYSLPALTPVPNADSTSYAAGSIEILNVVTLSHAVSLENPDAIPREPVEGYKFLGIRYSFVCDLDIGCANPPEALQLALKIGDAQMLYKQLVPPRNIPHPVPPHVSNEFWMIFEIPENATPDRLLLYVQSQVSVDPETISIMLPIR